LIIWWRLAGLGLLELILIVLLILPTGIGLVGVVIFALSVPLWLAYRVVKEAANSN
jgi:hypothetical protein